MMATTHALWGMALGVPLVAIAPEFALPAIIAGFIGGVAPDLDLYSGHRKTLHYPFVGTFVALVAIAIALTAPGPLTVALAIGLTASALHSLADIFGGGLEVRPWEGTSDRGVYSHIHGRWLLPKRTIRYDGSPEDLALASVAAVPLVIVGDVLVQVLVAGLLGVSVTYVLLRRRIAEVTIRLASVLPTGLRRYVPRRYLVR